MKCGVELKGIGIVLEESGKYAIDYGDSVLRDGVQSVSILPNILG